MCSDWRSPRGCSASAMTVPGGKVTRLVWKVTDFRETRAAASSRWARLDPAFSLARAMPLSSPGRPPITSTTPRLEVALATAALAASPPLVICWTALGSTSTRNSPGAYR